MRFKAAAVCAMEMSDTDCFAVVLAEHQDGRGARLEFQRALSFDEQDRSLGQDTYCICNEWGGAYYGGVVSWAIVGDVLEIRLDRAASDALGLADVCVVELEVGSEVRAELKYGLRRVFDELS